MWATKKIEKTPKTAMQMERHLKGIANHWRIEILLLVSERGGITLDGIVQSVQGSYPTIAEHVSRLVRAGLVEKKYKGRNVAHNLTSYGKKFVSFLITFKHYA